MANIGPSGKGKRALRRLAKAAAHPLTLLAALVLHVGFLVAAAPLSASIERVVGIIVWAVLTWHWAYIGAFVGAPTRRTRNGVIATYLAALIAVGLAGFLDGAAAELGLGAFRIAAVLLLIGLAGAGMSRVFGRRSIWMRMGLTIAAVYSVPAGFLYFSRLHDGDGAPRGAKGVADPSVARALTGAQAAFWRAYLEATGADQSLREVDAFGDSEAMQDELLDLVLAGTKRATASLARWYDADTLPKPGDLSLITDGRGEPACIIRTTTVDVVAVRDVDADFAFAEGEGDRSHEYWITEHRKFWTREAAREGFEYSDDLDVVCERFELVWPARDEG